MKKNILDRFLLTIYTLTIIFGSLFTLLISFGAVIGFMPISTIENYISSINLNWKIIIILGVVALIFLAVSIRLLFSGIKKVKPHSALLKNTDLGMIWVSVPTLDTLTQKAVRSFTEVKDVKSIIIPESDGIRVHIKIMVMPDVKLPELTVSIQQNVKDYVESLSGITVKEVRIYIDNLATVQKNRVE